MFIHPWDAALNEQEWRDWLTGTDRFGVLAVNNVDPAKAPLVLPTHFTLAGQELVLHLARPNPVWPHLEAATEVSVTVTGDYAYIPGYWRKEDSGVPTSYYSTVQFTCRPTIVDDPHRKAALLTEQLADFQPEGRHGQVAPGEAPYGRMLSGLRGVRLEILHVDAKFKYDDEESLTHRRTVSAALDERNHGLDMRAAAQQRRRLAEIGEWRTRP